jgi:signal transduction histidine kinase
MDLTLAQKQKLILVLAALMPIVFFTLQGWLKLSLPLPQPLVLIAALFGIRPLIKALEKREANHRQTQRELDKAAFAAEADARMIAALTEKNAEIERQAAELALKNTQLEALSAERAAMLADLAERNVSLRDAGHDFKVPLLGLTSLLNQVQDRATDDVQVQLLEQLDKGVEELRIMMFDLIEQGKAGTEMGKPLVQRLNVLDLAAYFHDSFYLAAHKRDVSFAVREEDFAIVANEMLLRRVISNLANNAILYSEPGTRVTLSFRRSSKRCFVRVYNTGPGIAEGSGPNRTANFNALIDRIKHRRQPITPNASQGHGLGLQIVERLCTELGTSISLQSHPGTFTVFRFSLPLAD